MKRSRVLVRLSAGLLLGLGALVLSASSRAEIIERVVAKVNGDIVTQSEFEARQLAAVQAAHIAPDQVESYLRQNNQRILQEAVDDLLITQRAAELGIKLRPEYIQDVIEGIKKENNIPSDEDLKRQLRHEGMSLDDLKRNIERSVLRRQVLSRELEAKAVVTDADARAEYEKHKAEYGKSASVHLQEIEVADSEQAQDIVRRARAGEDFAAMARAVSTAGSREAGGDLGQLSPGDMNPALARIVAALPAGGVSEPTLTDKGRFRIVRVVAKEEATVTPFEEVKEDLTKRLGQERMASAYEQYVEGLRKASEKTTRTTVSEVSLQVPNLPASTLSGPGLGPAPGVPETGEPTPAPTVRVPAVPGIDASEISTTPQARPERVAPPALPGQEPAAAPSPVPSPVPSPSPSPQG
jgi:parvulin-like peptidyl-prolyl isomerase